MLKRQTRNQSDSIIFNGVDLSKLVFCKVQRPVLAPIEVTSEEINGGNGAVYKGSRRASYDLPVDIWIRTEDRRAVADLRHKLAAALWTDEPKPLYLPDDPTRYLLAVVSGSTDIDKISDDCPSATITFKIVDPDYYGRKRRVEFTGETALSSGGNIDAHFKATVKGASGDRFRLTNLDTAEFVEVVGKLTGDSVIRIDTGLERATVNNRTAQVSIDSDFFKLGQRSRIRASSGSVLIEWSERWL